MTIINCPHCKDEIIITQIRCGIFRHGVIKKTNQQIDCHASKEYCDKMYDNNLIYGCGKPFKITKTQNGISVNICDYI